MSGVESVKGRLLSERYVRATNIAEPHNRGSGTGGSVGNGNATAPTLYNHNAVSIHNSNRYGSVRAKRSTTMVKRPPAEPYSGVVRSVVWCGGGGITVGQG